MTALEDTVREAADNALAPRKAMFEALLKSPTYLLHVEDGESGECAPSLEALELNLWAEADSELGGVWVPLFSTPEAAARYAQTLDSGERLRWVSQEPGRVYSLLTAIPRIAGVRLDPPGESVAGLEWSELKTLAEGRVPEDGPRLYELPDGPFRIPDGLRGRFGRLEPARVGFEGRQVVFPDEAPLALEDFRCWVRLTLEDEEEAWTPCRHFAALLRRLASRGGAPELVEELIAALIEFEMYGDAEAVCAGLVVEPGRTAFALGRLACIYRLSGRVEACLRVCEEGLQDFPGEIALYRNLALGRAQLEDLAGARETALSGLQRFPGDEILKRFA